MSSSPPADEELAPRLQGRASRARCWVPDVPIKPARVDVEDPGHCLCNGYHETFVDKTGVFSDSNMPYASSACLYRVQT